MKIGSVSSNFHEIIMKRIENLHHIQLGFETNPIVAILGPRQCGKTTLAKEYFKLTPNPPENYFDLEIPNDLARLQDPWLGLASLKGLIVIDEIQRRPDLFPTLRALIDQENHGKRYLILGSASRELIRQSSESLAGRIHYMELTPFSYGEVDNLEKLWRAGGFPRSYLADNDAHSMQWRQNYIRTYLEQDIPNLGIQIPAEHLRRFWMMLTHYHGQYFNASEIGNALGFSHHTIKKYLDILTGTFMIRQLPSWYENLAKRQVKTNKIYFRDSGILHALMNIHDQTELLMNPKIGASWEGFALESVIRHLNLFPGEAYFWAIHNQAELDLLIVRGMKKIGFEFKYSINPRLSKSMQISMKLLKLDHLYVIYPGEITFALAENITSIGLMNLGQIE
jgi:predicted AAA+ superfamily ATPase